MNTKKKFEFSKLIMVGVMLTYFIALFFVMGTITAMLITSNTQYLSAAITSLCTFVAAPVSVAIGFYSWKAKNENTVKLSYMTEQDAPQTIVYSNNNMPINKNDGI